MNDHVKAGAQPQDSGADWGSEVMARRGAPSPGISWEGPTSRTAGT